MYKLLKQEGSARRAEFTTNRGTVQSPRVYERGNRRGN